MYDLYPAVDDNYVFPPEVRQANAETVEFRNQVVPMTQTIRNNLTGSELWDNRLIFNTTTDRIDRYDLAGDIWVQVTSEPAGIIKEYGGDTAPAYHVMADGSVVPRDGIYANLFAVYGTKYNTGGETGSQFRLPNRKGKVAVGYDPSQTEFNALGKVSGSKTHTLTAGEMPSHGHGASTNTDGGVDHLHNSTITDGAGNHAHGLDTNQITPGTLGGGGGTLVREGFVGAGGRSTQGAGGHNHGINAAAADRSLNHAHGVNIDAAGGGAAHNNLQPSIAMNFIITL